MTANAATMPAPAAERRVPPLGGFNLTFLGLELRRMLRNRRTVIFTLLFPAGMFFAFGSGSDWNETVGLGVERGEPREHQLGVVLAGEAEPYVGWSEAQRRQLSRIIDTCARS